MATIFLNGLSALARRVPKDMQAREKRIARAISNTTTRGAALVRRRVPVAFSELRDSVQHDATRVFADAPHAAAVENGSRPHWVPLEPLIRWVKLRGMQGLSGRSMKRFSGTTTALHAARMRTLLALSVDKHESTPVDAPMQIAKTIQLAIHAHGTKPHHYMGGSVPGIVDILDEQIKTAVEEPGVTV